MVLESETQRLQRYWKCAVLKQYEAHSITHEVFLTNMFSFNLIKLLFFIIFRHRKYREQRNKLNSTTRKPSDKPTMWDVLKRSDPITSVHQYTWEKGEGEERRF